ncbi:DNA-directed RNA polymerase subunit H [Candidatus Woesearchaeota archaeon]|nr:DNA-directed RNA polymerase subunit H [Candidatus Woesearchaeota archaeon]
MSFDVGKHTLVPKHTKLSEKEKEGLLATYNITIKELPKISVEDPAIAKLGAKGGDIIRVERKSRTAGITHYFRVVVEE